MLVLGVGYWRCQEWDDMLEVLEWDVGSVRSGLLVLGVGC